MSTLGQGQKAGPASLLLGWTVLCLEGPGEAHTAAAIPSQGLSLFSGPHLASPRGGSLQDLHENAAMPLPVAGMVAFAGMRDHLEAGPPPVLPSPPPQEPCTPAHPWPCVLAPGPGSSPPQGLRPSPFCTFPNPSHHIFQQDPLQWKTTVFLSSLGLVTVTDDRPPASES